MSDSKTVFALRKEGRLNEALTLAEQLVSQDATSRWNIVACGWTLHDLIKAANKAGDRPAARALLEKLNQLPLSAGQDEKLASCREFWAGLLAEDRDDLPRAREASKAGRHDEALALYRQAVASRPDDAQAQLGLGWELAHALDAASKAETPDFNYIHARAQEYAQLSHVEKPGRLHSLVAARVARAAKTVPERCAWFPAFLRWWDPANLQDDDFKTFRPNGDGHECPSTAGRIAAALYKTCLHNQTAADLVAWATDLVGTICSRCNGEAWLPYYHAKMLIAMGRNEEARRLALPVIRQKSAQFWAWEVLGDTFRDDPARRQACLARALLCRSQDEKYLVGVREDLAEMLLAAGRKEAAAIEIARAAAARHAEGWKLTPRLAELARQTAECVPGPEASNEDLYRELGAAADQLLAADMPARPGMVMRINNDKQLTVVAMGAKDPILLPHNRFPASATWPVGTPVEWQGEYDQDREYWRVHAAHPLAAMPAAGWVSEAAGLIGIKPGARFGFVDDIYVHPDFVQAENIRDQDFVHVTAVRAWDRKKECMSWHAVKVSRDPTNRKDAC